MKYKGGVIIAQPWRPGSVSGKYVVIETNIKDPRLASGELITTFIITEFVQDGARVLIQRKGDKL